MICKLGIGKIKIGVHFYLFVYSAGDETPVNLAIVQASKRDCGVYGCKITNDHGTDITDLLLSAESRYYITVLL